MFYQDHLYTPETSGLRIDVSSVIKSIHVKNKTLSYTSTVELYKNMARRKDIYEPFIMGYHKDTPFIMNWIDHDNKICVIKRLYHIDDFIIYTAEYNNQVFYGGISENSHVFSSFNIKRKIDEFPFENVHFVCGVEPYVKYSSFGLTVYQTQKNKDLFLSPQKKEKEKQEIRKGELENQLQRQLQLKKEKQEIESKIEEEKEQEIESKIEEEKEKDVLDELV